MQKEQYEAPFMEVIEMEIEGAILAGSGAATYSFNTESANTPMTW